MKTIQTVVILAGMSTVDTSYTFSAACDTRTGVSMGIALLVTTVVAVALGVLAHLGYINPVIAYTVAPISGVLLLLIGAAVACIRSDGAPSFHEGEPLLKPQFPPLWVVQGGEMTPEALLKNKKTKAVQFETEEMVRIYPPDADHPFYYRVVRVQLEAAYMDVEAANFRDTSGWVLAAVGIRFNRSEYHISLRNLQEIQGVKASFANKIFDSSRYTELTKYRFPARLFLQNPDSISFEKGVHCVVFQIPDYQSYRLYNDEALNPSKNRVIYFTRTHGAPPPYPVKDFNIAIPEHKAIVDILQSDQWSWQAPGEITNVFTDHNGDVVVTYNRIEN